MATELLTINTVLNQGEHFANLPSYIPATLTAVTLASIWIIDLTLTNVTSSQQWVTLIDNQATPLAFLDQLPLAPNQTIAFSLNGGRLLSLGAFWQASNSNAVVGFMRGYGPPRPIQSPFYPDKIYDSPGGTAE